MQSNNPTAMSAVVGEEISLAAGDSRRTELLKGLTMPALLVVFAAYLAVGMITMRVPEGTAFPGPRFFPAIIAAGLLLFAVLLALAAIRAAKPEPALHRVAGGAEGDGFDLLAAAEDSGDGTAVTRRAVGIDWRSLAWVVISFLAFALLLPYLGWVIAAALLFWCVSRGFGAQKPIASLIVGFTVSSIVYIAFDMLLGMSLPSGVLGWGF